ncbi:MAG: hypothetical protein FJX18_05200 [Alphaproteobacteria bacterium]|nr:hypothetical protein [Alphaproteobacteria bacterium]
MFFKKNPFIVKALGRSGLLYQEGKKSMKIDSEMLVGPNYDIVIYKDSVKQWNPPFENDPVNEDDKNRILSNAKIDLQSGGYKVDFN